jgi:hypothetical protein
MPLKASDRLILVRIKLERAKKHLCDLEAELRDWRGKYSAIVIRGEDPKVPLGLSQMSYDPFTRVPLLPANAIAAAGDVIHNLRSALDHLAYQLAMVGTPGIDPGREVGFPVAKDLASYEHVKVKKVQRMKPEVVKAIDALKPYKGGNDALWRIHELDNIDKHRTHFTVAHDYLLAADWMPGEYLVRISGTPTFTGSFDQDIQESIQSEMEKTLGESEIVQGKAMLPLLTELVEFVNKLVTDFEQFLE